MDLGVTASTRSLGSGQPPGDAIHPPWPLSRVARASALAAGGLALAELALQRVGAPVASHVPGTPGGRRLADVFGTAGDLAAGAVAVLVVATAAGLVAGFRRRPLLASALAAATLSTVIATAGGAPAALSHLTVIIAAALVVGFAVAVSSPLHAAGVATAGAVVVAGQWALLDGAGAAGAGALAEVAIVGVPLCLVAGLLRARRPAPLAWLGAGIAAGLVAAVLLVQPGHAALVALWSVGAALALPTPLYVVGAGAVGLLVADWMATPGRRHRAAGLLLLIVAGLQPTLVHHNLTALIGLLLLALPAGRTGGLDA